MRREISLKNEVFAISPQALGLESLIIFRISAKYIQSYAPLAQLDRASGYEPEGREFESLRARFFASTRIDLVV